MRIEDDLLAANRRQIARRRRLRRWLIPAGATSLALTAAVATAAVTATGPFAGGGGDANVYAPSGAAQIVVSHDEANRASKALAFIGTGDAYCVQVPPVTPQATATRPAMVCEPSSAVAKRLLDGPAVVAVASITRGDERATLVAGIVDETTTSVTVGDANRGVSRPATLSEVWTGDARPAARAFLAELPAADSGHSAALTITTNNAQGDHNAMWPPTPASQP